MYYCCYRLFGFECWYICNVVLLSLLLFSRWVQSCVQFNSTIPNRISISFIESSQTIWKLFFFFSFSLILFSWLHFAFTYTFLCYRNGYMFVSVCEYICCIVEYLFVGSLIALVLVCCCCLYELEMKVKFSCKVLYFYSIVSE